MSSFEEISKEIELFLKEPEKRIQEDIVSIFLKWKKNLIRSYYLTKKDYKFSQIIKAIMLNQINNLFDEIMQLDVRKENKKIETLLENKDLQNKIEEIIAQI